MKKTLNFILLIISIVIGGVIFGAGHFYKDEDFEINNVIINTSNDDVAENESSNLPIDTSFEDQAINEKTKPSLEEQEPICEEDGFQVDCVDGLLDENIVEEDIEEEVEEDEIVIETFSVEKENIDVIIYEDEIK